MRMQDYVSAYQEPLRTLERWKASGLHLRDPDQLVLQAADLPGKTSDAVLRLLDPRRRELVARRIDELSKPPTT